MYPFVLKHHDARGRPVILRSKSLWPLPDLELTRPERWRMQMAIWGRGYWIPAACLCASCFADVSLLVLAGELGNPDWLLSVISVSVAVGAVAWAALGLLAFFKLLPNGAKRRITAAMLTLERCPACAYSLRGVEADADGCVQCPECGAAWRLPTQPASNTTAPPHTTTSTGDPPNSYPS